MIRDFIREQPAVIERVLARFPQALDTVAAAPAPREIRLIGSGTSKNALFAVAPTFERLLRVRVRVEGPLAFLKSAAPGDDCLAVVLSQTGTSTTSIAALERAQELGFRTLALTAEASSGFAGRARCPLTMPVGPEPVGPKTKGYTASIACLLLLARHLAGSAAGIRFERSRIEPWIAEAERAVAPLASRGIDQVMVLAQDAHEATALEGALKVAEMAGVAAAAFDTEEALHGRFHALSPDSLALFVAADSDAAATAAGACEGLAGLGITGRILDLAGTAPAAWRLDLAAPASGELDLALAIVPFQWLATTLAEARGMRPEDMRYPDMSRRLRIKTPGGPP